MQNNVNVSNGKVKLSGLWVSKTKNGESYMSGSLGNGLRISVFKNKFKRNDNDPDYELVLSEVKAPQQQVQQPTRYHQAQQPRPQQQQQPHQRKEDINYGNIDYDDIFTDRNDFPF
jgi:hypothetical protein